ncbi:Chemotaxis response regulator containing a CheY-like receiver domain and a methylesterase domain [Hahella chejuensis KCTC 2396]|uniref:Protein-glutamate methylesterase/protein-glutamine glutaminase 2 n=1 Tax=Hahella chejuensis (strain KCTC 2396) TaxID=349521 RepID=CHEB2_HAHCH|nr:chemotaxis response regulator protein-glutamate methylesterase [Hahella chejuensis]Q2SFY4.1 RecName: Full=Protein-glutamate methylesterase/protein-glutamine glutaminase 2 [Hahella chejuensis KCTC 2396]ABC30440.1 Chemotaxis response regulator containing a CheY-like receiver domain and a methylesterase domain [Hahella chejuensis KCTC 2396]
MNAKIKVLLVDDSAVVRQVLQQVLERDKNIEVIGAAADPIFAQLRMSKQWPDVIVLDVEMPRMDGITFLKKLMAERPTPVVMCSTLTSKGAQTSMKALAAGAVAVVAKPAVGVKEYLESAAGELIMEIKAAAKANMRNMPAATASAQSMALPAKFSADAVIPLRTGGVIAGANKIAALGTSTGGTQALEYVLTRLPRNCPGIVIVQHMPEKFTAAFAERLNSICELEILEAESGHQVAPGRALIAPGGKHMLLRRSGAQYFVEIMSGPPVNRHRPSVDVLFRSVAQAAGRNALGVIMTGMGDDGAKGLLEMRNAGALTIGQDERSCIVYGMPKEAAKIGAVTREISLERIPQCVLDMGASLTASAQRG